MKLQAFAYLRVSGKGQIDKDGFTRQEQTIRTFSKSRFEIVQIFKDGGVSGTTDESNRPAFQEMMAEVLKNGVRTVIVEGLDRLARELRIQETMMIYLASKGVTMFSARTGENVTEAMMSDPMRKALVQMQGVFSELEKAMMVKKLRAARDRIRKKTGKCEGRKGYGESPECAEILNHIRAFSKIRRTSIWIAEWLNDNNFKPLHNDKFNSQIVRNVKHRLKIA
jgi:DNA invertase Pin-like site-specific DNA recombinase